LDFATPTAWRVEETSSTDVLDSRGKKKYIVGMGVKATRPFVPTIMRRSTYSIKN